MSRPIQCLTLNAALVATLAFPLFSQAESVLLPAQASTNQAYPSVSPTRQGEPLRFTWQDGRQAVLRVKKSKVAQIPLKLAITENLCEDRIARPAPKCIYRIATQELTTDIGWEKHPDTSKIGQTVKAVLYYRSSPDGPRLRSESEYVLQQNDFSSSTSFLLDPNSSGDALFDELTCDDFHWLTGAESKDAPLQALIESWSSEMMIENPETNESENRYLGNGYGLKFVKSGPQTLRLVSARSLGSHFGGSPTLFGDVISIVLRQTAGPNAGDTCQVTLKPNLGEATQLARQIQEAASKSAQFVPVTDFEERPIKTFLKNNAHNFTSERDGGEFE